MMQQYQQAKQMCGDALLFFRMGDFYELFYEDAKTASKAVGLTLTSRDKGTNPIAMAGFPHHQLEGYLGKLIKLGFRVAICEQVEDPKKAKGLVKREVTRVVTPGTLTDDSLLDPKENNFLAAVVQCRSAQRNGPPEIGMSWVELSTGRFFAATVPADRLADEITRIAPAELLVSDDSAELGEAFTDQTMITHRPAWSMANDVAWEGLTKHFGTAGLEGFGFDSSADSPAVRAAGGVIDYLKETQKSSLDHIDTLVPYRGGHCLEIDQATRRSLELTRTLREGGRDGSLLAVIDRTVTAMGSRLLCDWMNNPLTDADGICLRLDAVDELLGEQALGDDLRTMLRDVYDLQRLLARVTTARASPRDLGFIGQTLRGLPVVKARLSSRRSRRSRLLCQLEAELDLCPDLNDQLEAALAETLPLASREGGILRADFNARLDELRDLAKGGKEWIARYQAEQMETAGIPNLKVGHNKVFGFYIEVTNSHKDKVPPHFIRKQTLKNAERYITPELKEYEEKVLSAEEQAFELEYELFLELRELVQASAGRMRRTADVLAQLDVLTSLAELARQRGYCRPDVSTGSHLEITDGRHPVLDIIEPQGTFVPNDTYCGDGHGTVMLITGPNMAGKSTYIRQVALITLMAQMGSFVPAKSARLGIADRIFARVGASDELARGQSTFMVEMIETARILNTATSRSLVILDEIGRGTSTYDGISLAWAIVEHIHDTIGCRTFFATHYHELTDLTNRLDGVRNLNVEVKEWEDRIVFLHKIIAGAADKSYGIHVAQLAGVPNTVNERAKEVLKRLEADHTDVEIREKLAQTPQPRVERQFQLNLFEPDHPLLDEIRELDLNGTSPLDALQRIQQWQETLAEEQLQSKPR